MSNLWPLFRSELSVKRSSVCKQMYIFSVCVCTWYILGQRESSAYRPTWSVTSCYSCPLMNEWRGSFSVGLMSSLLSVWSRHAVCIFYLVLRALDTVEDDMTIPLDKKVPMLNDFHTYLYQDEWCFTESQEKDRQVLEDFPTVSSTAWWFINGQIHLQNVRPKILV